MPSVNKENGSHPCYSAEAGRQYARLHLPVAPACNISCNYCSRKYDCVNESRPGVTSEILTPEEALTKFVSVKERLPNLAVVGIAGPGDALANWPQTKKTIKLIGRDDKDIALCLSTNGLMLSRYADELMELGVRHITVTVNCLDPQIGAKLYKHINYEGRMYEGIKGARILIDKQQEGIRQLVQNGALVKVNMVMVEGINDLHLAEVAKEVSRLGVFIGNIMPMTPAQGSVFQNFSRPGSSKVDRLRDLCRNYLPQMAHCRQCRADAAGMLGENNCRESALKNTSYCRKREAV